MNWEHLAISILLLAALAVAFYIERRRYMQKSLRRLHEQGLRAEAIRPRPRNWYRFRAGLALFILAVVSCLLIQWILPDTGWFGTGTLFDALFLGSLVLFGAVLYGQWLGDMWFDIADAAYREAKAKEDAQRDEEIRC